MNDIESKKKELENAIVDTMLSAAKNQAVADEELSVIATVVLDKIDDIYDETDYRNFLRDLTSRWEIFNPLLTLELSKDKEKMEQEAIKQALMHVQQGNIDKALEMAKSGTNIMTQ